MRWKRRKSKRNNLRNDVVDITASGVTIGVGTAVVAGMGGAGSAAVLPAFAVAGSMLGPYAMVKIGGHALRGTEKLIPKKKYKSKSIYAL